jgi:molybdate transport system substrate-binding protein
MILEEAMRMIVALVLAAALSILAALGGTTAEAGEIKLLVANALKSSLDELAPKFEKESESKLIITVGAAADLKALIEKGAAVDVAVLPAAVTDALVKEGKLAADGRADIARSGAGVAGRKGTPKLDISTTEGFRRALLDAKSIAYSEAGPIAQYILRLFDSLGIAEQVKSKLRPQPTSNPAAKAVADGEAELGISQISEILPNAGAELVGPLPPEIQVYTVYPAAVATSAKEPDAAKALIKFLATPAAVAVLKAKGLNPG